MWRLRHAVEIRHGTRPTSVLFFGSIECLCSSNRRMIQNLTRKSWTYNNITINSDELISGHFGRVVKATDLNSIDICFIRERS